MVKVLEERYPMGTLPRQKSPGRYFDGILKENIDILAKKIVDDMQFFGVCCCSTYEVRSGKSTFIQQIGEYYTDSVNRQHNLNLTFDMKNIVFGSKAMMERALELPKYSVLIVDEDDQVDESYFSELSKNLRRFFRKSGQLNLFIILITTDYFKLRPGYAISRSTFMVDVRFEGEFERGYFSFYNFDKKRQLYVQGKRTYNFKCVQPDFIGRFTDGYAVNKEEYLAAKRADLESKDEDKKIDPNAIKLDVEKAFFIKMRNHFKKKLSIKEICDGMGISERTGYNYCAKNNEFTENSKIYETEKTQKYNNILKDKTMVDESEPGLAIESIERPLIIETD